MGMHSGRGDHENTIKTRKNGESNFHLKRCPKLGPTKQSGAFPAERGHRGKVPTTQREEGGLSHCLGNALKALL